MGALTKTASDSGFGWSFAFSDMHDYTEFTSLFDQYRIDAVTVSFTVRTNTGAWPLMYVWQDRDDSTAPTAISDAEVVQSAKRFLPSSTSPTVTLRLNPRPKVPGISGNTYTSERAMWCDCAVPGEAHYGLKLWLLANTGDDSVITMSVRYHFSMRGVR